MEAPWKLSLLPWKLPLLPQKLGLKFTEVVEAVHYFMKTASMQASTASMKTSVKFRTLQWKFPWKLQLLP